MSETKPNFDATPPPKAVVNRLSLYLREVQKLMAEGHDTISSNKLGRLLGFTDAQVRKDFAVFGQFGYPGRGYKCRELVDKIKQILGTDRVWPVALVGCGNLGQALIGYSGFLKRGFQLVAAFDTSPALVGKKIGPLVITHFAQFAPIVKELRIRLAILAVPGSAAQAIAKVVAEAGITGILNFAPVVFELPKSVTVASVDLAVELERLSFTVVSMRENE